MHVHVVPYSPCLDLSSVISLDEEIQTDMHLGRAEIQSVTLVVV